MIGLTAFAGCETPQEPLEHPALERPSALAVDAHTLLLLHFEGDFVGQQGEQPTEASGPTFEAGIVGQGVLLDDSDRLAYGSAGNFNAPAGTIEFWIRPRWPGNDQTGHVLFSMGDVLGVVKDGADNLRFVLGADDSESYRAYYAGGWIPNAWHHIAVTWSIPGMMKTYVDAVEVISHPSVPQDLITAIPAQLVVGSRDGYPEQPDAVFDELRISNIVRTPQEIAASYAEGFALLGLAIQPITAEPYETWRQPAKLIATTTSGTREYPPGLAQWSSASPEVATVDGDGVIRALKAGTTTISATIGAVRADLDLRVKAPLLPPVVEQIQPFLATPAAGYRYEMPVVVLRYLPTADGLNLDVAVAPDFWELGPVSLAEMRRRLDLFDVRAKFMLEEGSRFRGYRDPAASPSLGYRVIAYITVYEPTPPGKVVGEIGGLPTYLPDYTQILERFGGRHFVEALGVKEFWIWQTQFDAGQPSYDPAIHKPEVFRGLWESNMSSPSTGDISNSDRDPSDLPVYDRTYMVYGQNIRRSQNEAVHNHGHQLEAILSHVNAEQDGNTTLFWEKFVGTLGRCGSTHSPPNTTEGYDYDNPALVTSDIADWTPAGTGQKAPVNADTWGTHAYAWPAGTGPTSPQEAYEPHWYIYWMQSMPGLGNTIPYGRNTMTNWWQFTADWDGSIRSGLGLYGATPAPSCAEAITPAAARAAVRALADDVADLVRAGLLSRSEGHALRVKLDAAARSLAEGHLRPAANILGAFEHQLAALVRSGRVRSREVQTLRAELRCLARRIERS